MSELDARSNTTIGSNNTGDRGYVISHRGHGSSSSNSSDYRDREWRSNNVRGHCNSLTCVGNHMRSRTHGSTFRGLHSPSLSLRARMPWA
jgi:hypothetical protein